MIAEIADDRVHVRLRAAPPVTLHGDACWRTDGNSPVRTTADGVTVYFSDYLPRGHTLRRQGRHGFQFDQAAAPITLTDDPDPLVGKWIEAVWKGPEGLLRGWYHGEEPASCPRALFIPHIGALVSADDGLSWRCCGELLRVPPGQFDCAWENGFFAGGYGDLCVLPDPANHALYMFFTSYLLDEDAQGVVVARMVPRPGHPGWEDLELWCGEGWRPAAGRRPKPLWPQTRGWRHADPQGFWGPAVHYNAGLGAYVMLLNRTAGGASDLRQQGIYLSVSRTLEDPTAWSTPLMIVRGGGWYPQSIGLEAGTGDAQCGAASRFFMAGFSAWQMEIGPSSGPEISAPLVPTADEFHRQFGARRCPW